MPGHVHSLKNLMFVHAPASTVANAIFPFFVSIVPSPAMMLPLSSSHPELYHVAEVLSTPNTPQSSRTKKNKPDTTNITMINIIIF
jgi:hypothetical protein